MGISPAPKTERNIEIYKRLQAGESPMDLANEFDLFLSRIYQIKRNVQKKIDSGKLSGSDLLQSAS